MNAITHYRDLAEDEISAALQYLDASCTRDEWVRIGMAIKSELGSAGFALWDDWSKGGKTYNSTDARDTWKSIKPAGGITIATLIHEAQQFGFALDERQREPIDQAEQERRRTQRRAEDEAERLERDRKRAMAAERAASIWNLSADVDGDDHPYLQRKGVKSFGLRLGKWRNNAEALLIPLQNIDGHLVSLQAIFANDNTDIGRDRDYLPGGQKRGAFYMVGGKPIGAQPVIAICEGYATGATLHMAGGYCAAVAFDAGNVPTVARAMRELYPTATLLICADNDQWHKPGTTNDGIHYARQAASSANGILVVPKFTDLSSKPTDFNDLHALEGIEAVREQLQDAIPKADNDDFLDWESSVNPFLFPHLSDRQQPLNTRENLQWMLEQYGITARYNVIKKDVEVSIPGAAFGRNNTANVHLAEINSLCARNRMPKADTADYIKVIGKLNSFNPAADFILSKPWDGVSRLEALYDTLETESDYPRNLLALFVRRWLVSAVAAALKPEGFWSKGVLVLQGPQSLGKTAWFKSLVPTEQRKLIKVGARIDPNNKDTISSAIGHWMVELGELDGTFRKADIAALKAFISQDVDQLRRPYDRLEESYDRQTVFFASVNPERFLADDTGNTRWWTVPVIGVNENHDIDVQQLWAEVVTMYRDGERWWLERDEESELEAVNADHADIDPVEELILANYDVKAPQRRNATATDILLELGYRPSEAKSAAKKAGNVLKKLFGKSVRSNGKNCFSVPKKLENRAPV